MGQYFVTMFYKHRDSGIYFLVLILLVYILTNRKNIENQEKHFLNITLKIWQAEKSNLMWRSFVSIIFLTAQNIIHI